MSIVAAAVVKANMTSSGQPFLEIDPVVEKNEKTMKAVRQILNFISEKWPREYGSMVAFKGKIIMRPKQDNDGLAPDRGLLTISGKYLLQIGTIQAVLRYGLEGETKESCKVQCQVAGDFANMFYTWREIKPQSPLVKWSFFCLIDPGPLELNSFCFTACFKPVKAAVTLLAVAVVVMAIWRATQLVEDPLCHSTVWILLGVSLCVMIEKMQKVINVYQHEARSDLDQENAQRCRRRALFIAKGLGKDRALEDLMYSPTRCVETLGLIKEIESLKNKRLEGELKEGLFRMAQFPNTTSSGALLPYLMLDSAAAESVRKMFSFISERAPEEYEKWVAEDWHITAHDRPYSGIASFPKYLDRRLTISALVINGIRNYGLKGDTENSIKIQVCAIELFAAMVKPSPKMKRSSNVFTHLIHLGSKEHWQYHCRRGLIRLIAEHPKKAALYATALNAVTFLERGIKPRIALMLLSIIPLLYKTYKAYGIYNSEKRDLNDKSYAERLKYINRLLEKCLGNEVLSKHKDAIEQISSMRTFTIKEDY